MEQTWSGSSESSIAAHSLSELISLLLHTAGLIYLWFCHPVGNNPMGRHLPVPVWKWEIADLWGLPLGGGWGQLLEWSWQLLWQAWTPSCQKSHWGKKLLVNFDHLIILKLHFLLEKYYSFIVEKLENTDENRVRAFLLIPLSKNHAVDFLLYKISI